MMRRIIYLIIITLTNMNLCYGQWIPTNTETMLSIHFINQNVGWAVGQNGTILKSTDSGITWNSQESNTSNWLSCVIFTDLNNGYATGENQTFLKTTDGGNNWITMTGPNTSFYGTYFIDSNTGWIIGPAGNIFKTVDGGLNWSSQSVNTTDNLSSIFFYDSNNGWIAGKNGIVLKTNDSGSNWTFCNSITDEFLNSVHFVDTNNGWASGANGTIIHTNDGGLNWTLQNTNTSFGLWGVSFTDVNNGWAAGQANWDSDTLTTIIKTTNGGFTWIFDESGNYDDAESVFCLDSEHVWIATDSYILRRNDETGIFDDITNNNSIVVYPNPTSTSFNLKNIYPDVSYSSIELFNLNGEKLNEYLINKKMTINETHNFPIDFIESGVYIIRIRQREKTEYLKLIVN